MEKPITVGDVICALNGGLARPEWQEKWDRAGFSVGDPTSKVRGILCALDVTPEVVEEAHSKNLNMIVTHHPLIFSPLRSVTSGAKRPISEQIVFRAASLGIACFSAHTNLDASSFGHNMLIASRLGLSDVRPLSPPRDAPAVPRDAPAEVPENMGVGLVGVLPAQPTLREFAETCREAYPSLAFKVAATRQRLDLPVHRVAVCSGSGASLWRDCAGKGADVLVTGDVKHHDAIDAVWSGVALIDCGHFGTERCAVDILTEFLGGRFPGVAVEASAQGDIFVDLGAE
eukprot:gnl/Chilomastix_cuspidata/2439.p1 GENE.gnl/Chilomastix_cuspidata/2439~~gnl/Chilomastix_cuspidata/2439.p1  ORF type:complete len:287 (-),score=89.98 gnl/Chilomastix_cuspidata/2439:942-1802(-)